MKNLLFIVCSVFFSGLTLDAQVQFQSSNEILENGSFTMGFSDVNGDYRDDVVIQGGNRNVHLFLQTENRGMQHAKTIDLTGDTDWSLAVLDMDNDGKKEIISSGAYNGTNLIGFDNTIDFSYQINIIEPGIIFAQNANSVDINKDGFLDYFVCHDDGDSHMYMNDGSGKFTLDNSMFDFSTVPSTDGSGNYGSIWADIDGDDDMDLYIAKCRGFVSSTSDPRRINQLHINNGDGTFTDQAVAFGLASGEQTWAADFADADNDGDLDCFMVQHTGVNMLFENVDNIFTPRPDYVTQPISGIGFQGFFADLDNDGLVDIIIAGDSDYILWNKGGLKFETENNPTDGQFEFASLALGDSNSDGFMDILGSYSSGFGVGSQKSEIWLNSGNDNNHVAVSLRGVQSNMEGVGAKIRVYSALGTQIRNVTSGEGYGVVNSLTQRYGLSIDQNIDSLEVLWPSGHRDLFQDLEVNKHYLITEGDCISTIENNFYQDYTDVFCEGESTTISSNEVLDWNTGENTNEIEIFSSGFYNANLPQDANCHTAYGTIIIEAQSEEKGLIDFSSKNACLGDSIILVSSIDNVTWSNGMQTNQITVGASGNYSFTAVGNCSDIKSDTINIQILDPGTVEDQTIESVQGDDVEIQVDGENIEWFTMDDLITPFYTGNILTINDIQESVEYKVQNNLQSTGLEANVGIEEVADGYSSNGTNAGLYFDVFEDLVLEGVTINTDLLGPRKIEIVDINGFIVSSTEVDITEVGEQFVPLNFTIEQGNDYFITTNEIFNINNLGFAGPRFARSVSVVGYPFVGEGLMEITTSYFGPEYYYYFYNWQVTTGSTNCPSNLASVEIDVETVNVNDLNFLNELTVYPIPASNNLNIRSDIKNIAQIELYDMKGKLTYRQQVSGTFTQIDMNSLTNGLYVLKIISETGKNAFLKVPCISR